MTTYKKRIQSRSKLKFILGIITRLKKHIINRYINWLAKRKGAIIGENVTLNYKLAKKANSNLIVGNNTSIQTDLIDLRAKVIIGNNVIIGGGAEILTCSHNVDSINWEFKPYGITIDDYVWLATRVFVLPSCTHIGKGAVCAAGSVIVKNVESLSITSGNPAKHLRFRTQTHTHLIVESLLGNDLSTYIKTYLAK
ncbi:acyltransferase [Lacinutrix sp. MEBiC02595]